MTALSDILSDRHDLVQLPTSQMASSAALDSAIEAIHQRWPNVLLSNLDDMNRKELVERIARHHKEGNWQGVMVSDAVSAARVAFDADFLKETSLNPLRHFLINQIGHRHADAYVKGMFDVYRVTFIPGSRHTHEISIALQLNADRHPNDFWRPHIPVLPTILAKDAHHQIAECIDCDDKGDPKSVLHRFDIRNYHDTGLALQVHLAMVERYEARLANDCEQTLDNFFRWLCLADDKPRQIGGGCAIEAMIKPWFKQDPSEKYQMHLVNRVIATYGDPRIKRGGVWKDVQECHPDVMNTLHRWLAGNTMELFLETISQSLTNSDNDNQQMWKKRKQFWLDMHKHKHIDAAWVAFSGEARIAANGFARKKEQKAMLKNFGIQAAGGSRSQTSLLILKIGNSIVVEGSHSYKIHVFRKGNRNKPELYQNSYNCEDLRHYSDAEQTHHHGGSWQEWLKREVL